MSCNISSQEDLRNLEDQNISIENFAKEKEPKGSQYDEPKNTPKVIRVLTVIGYILAVSLAAIILSLYYVLMWNPPSRNQTNEIASAALKQMTTEDGPSLISPPTTVTNSENLEPSRQTTTEDSGELSYEEASSETKFDDNNIPRDNNLLDYDSASVSNETQYK